jgi:hypothetical protein
VMNSVSNLWVIRDSLKTNCSQPQLCHVVAAPRGCACTTTFPVRPLENATEQEAWAGRDRGREGDDAHAITPEVR